MKPQLLLTTAALFACSLISTQAGEKEDLSAAIKKLADKANYSWTSTSKRPENNNDTGGRGRGNSGPTTGKTADGLVFLSSTRGESTRESLVKGKKAATKRDGEWTAVEERTDTPDGDNGQARRRGRGGRDLSDFKSPAVQAKELLEKVTEVKKDGDAYLGSLSAEAAKAMVSSRGGRRRGGDDAAARPEPTGVKASAKFWIKDGVLAKFETVTAGSISVDGNDRDLARTNTTEIKDVGTTKIEVPEEAKKLLAE